MKNRELIKELKKLDPNEEVFIDCGYYIDGKLEMSMERSNGGAK